MEKSSEKKRPVRSRHQSKPRELLNRFTDSDRFTDSERRTLETDFKVRKRNLKQFIRSTEGFVLLFNRMRLNEPNLKQARDDCKALEKASHSLLRCVSLIWPAPGLSSPEEIWTSHRIHQMSSFRAASEANPVFAESLRASRFVPQLPEGSDPVLQHLHEFGSGS